MKKTMIMILALAMSPVALTAQAKKRQLRSWLQSAKLQSTRLRQISGPRPNRQLKTKKQP